MKVRAVRLWVEKLEHVTVNVEAKPRRMIAVDETKVKVDCEWCYLWASIGVDTCELRLYGFVAEEHTPYGSLPEKSG